MPYLLGVCPNGHIFQTSFFLENINNGGIFGVGARCTRCDAIGQVLEGTYSTNGQALMLLSGPEVTVEILTKLRKLFQDAEAKKYSKQQVINDLPKELKKSQQLQAHIIKLIKNASLADWATVIGALIALITLCIQLKEDPNPTYNSVNNYNITFNIQQLHDDDGMDYDLVPQQAFTKKCRCGRDLIYKRCHGKRYYDKYIRRR